MTFLNKWAYFKLFFLDSIIDGLNICGLLILGSIMGSLFLLTHSHIIGHDDMSLQFLYSINR